MCVHCGRLKTPFFFYSANSCLTLLLSSCQTRLNSSITKRRGPLSARDCHWPAMCVDAKRFVVHCSFVGRSRVNYYKIKCDGVKPTCGKCERFRQECTYTDVVKKRGPRQGHIDLLEQRLRKMEELITTGSSVLEASPSSLPMVQEPINKPAVPRPIASTRTTEPPTLPSAYTDAHMTPAPPALTLPKTTPDAKCEWPAIDAVQHLVDIYFMHFETLSPIADVKGFKASILNKTCSTFLLYAILSVAAR